MSNDRDKWCPACNNAERDGKPHECFRTWLVRVTSAFRKANGNKGYASRHVKRRCRCPKCKED